MVDPATTVDHLCSGMGVRTRMDTTDAAGRNSRHANMFNKTLLCLEAQSADTSSTVCSVDPYEACVSHLMAAWQDSHFSPSWRTLW